MDLVGSRTDVFGWGGKERREKKILEVLLRKRDGGWVSFCIGWARVSLRYATPTGQGAEAETKPKKEPAEKPSFRRVKIT